MMFFIMIGYISKGNMKKICFVLEHFLKYSIGGAELQAYYIAQRLAKDNDVHYIYVESDKDFLQRKFGKRDDDITLHRLKRYNYKIFNETQFLNYFELQKLLRKIDPDLIYQRCGNSHTGIAARWSKKNGKKMVFGISSDYNCSSKGILNFNMNFPNYPFKILNYFFTNDGIKKADLIIAQTNYQKRLLKLNFNVRAIVIPNAHPIPEEPFEKPYPPIVAWIGNIKPLKKPELFIKLADKLKDVDVKFVYAGRPSTNYYQNFLMKNSEKLPNLDYLGEIPFEKTNELLSKSSLFVNTSITEGFPNTYIQAWMRKTPVVTLTCDPDDLIKRHGLGFHSGSFEQLVKDVRYLIENEDVRREMGEKARRYALKNHDIKKIGELYLDAFEKLLH